MNKSSTNSNGLKIFVSVDMEGISGIVHPSQTGSDPTEYALGRTLMAKDVNAAIEFIVKLHSTLTMNIDTLSQSIKAILQCIVVHVIVEWLTGYYTDLNYLSEEDILSFVALSVNVTSQRKVHAFIVNHLSKVALQLMKESKVVEACNSFDLSLSNEGRIGSRKTIVLLLKITKSYLLKAIGDRECQYESRHKMFKADDTSAPQKRTKKVIVKMERCLVLTLTMVLI